MKTKKEIAKHQIFVLELFTFPYDIVVSIGGTIEEIKKGLLKKGVDKELIDPISDSALGHTAQGEKKYVVMVLPLELDDAQSIGVLAHEATHATQFILKTIATPLSEDTYEVYAYMTDTIVRECLRRRWKFLDS